MASDSQIFEEQSLGVEFKVKLSLDELIAALRNLSAEEREFFLENLLAALSSEYLKSIEEARKDYEVGRVVSHEEVFQ